MEAGESGLYLFSACSVATLLWHPASPIQRPRKQRCSPDVDGRGNGSDHHGNRPITLGPAVRSALQSRSHTHVLSIKESGVVGRGVLLSRNFSAQFAGVALASLVLHGAPAHKAVRYAATIPSIYGDTIAFVAELAISFILMSASCARTITKSWPLIHITLPPSWLRHTLPSSPPCLA